MMEELTTRKLIWEEGGYSASRIRTSAGYARISLNQFNVPLIDFVSTSSGDYEEEVRQVIRLLEKALSNPCLLPTPEEDR